MSRSGDTPGLRSSRWCLRDLAAVLFPGLSPLVLDEVEDNGTVLRLRARTTTPEAACPRCGGGSRRVHAWLWVPRTLSRHATCTYSCRRPPSRSRRSVRMVAPEGGGVWPPGGGSVALAEGGLGQAGLMSHRPAAVPAPRSSFAGFRFPPEVIMLAVRWYLRYGLSYRDVEELLAERGIAVDHVTIYRWVQRFTPELIDAARPSRHVAGDRWFVDETYLKVAGRWVYLYRAIDQHGQVIDVLASPKRDLAATRRFFARALNAARRPTEVTTDRAPAYPRVLDELVPEAWHVVEQYANNPIEADHGRLKARTRPMRGLKRLRCAQVVCSGHAFVQNLRRGHYELGLRYRARPPARGDLHRTRPRHLNSASMARSLLPPPQRNSAA